MSIPIWLKSLFVFDELALDEAERVFIRHWVADLNERITKFGMILAGIYLLVCLPFMPFMLVEQALVFSVVCHSSLLVLIAVAAIYKRITHRPLATIAIFVHVVSCTLLAFFANIMLHDALDPDAKWLAIIALVGVCGWLMMACPSQYRAWKYVTAYYVAISLGSIIEAGVSPRATITVGIILCAMVGAKAMASTLFKREAANTYGVQQAAKATERQKIEHELMLARQIQDSMLPPPHLFLPGGAEVRVFRASHTAVGGDWAAVRQMDDGTLVMIVADAVGKGMQAALVVHAVQSMWARSLSEHGFDAAEWLGQVNGTLLHMGERASHAATVGIVCVRGAKVTYWSAAHPPAWAIGGDKNDRSVTAVNARGNMLGIDTDLCLTSSALTIGFAGGHVVFGSDGVFDKGTRHPKADILNILDQSLDRDELPHELCPAEDDKTLIVLSQKSLGLRAA